MALLPSGELDNERANQKITLANPLQIKAAKPDSDYFGQQ